ncbi:hypothetical protein ACJX0J_023607, partial [Zea mays]
MKNLWGGLMVEKELGLLDDEEEEPEAEREEEEDEDEIEDDNLDITVILFCAADLQVFQYVSLKGQTTHCFDFQQVQEHIRRTFDLSYVMLFIIDIIADIF